MAKIIRNTKKTAVGRDGHSENTNTLAANNPNLVKNLLAASAMLSCFGSPSRVMAQGHAEDPEVRLGFSSYREHQSGDEGSKDRMEVDVPMAWFKTPIPGWEMDVEGSFVYDMVSGASPLYHETLSEASVEDTRVGGHVTVTKFFNGFSVGVGSAVSYEDDYESNSVSLNLRKWTDDKNRTFSFGISYDDDTVSSTDDPNLDEGRNTLGVLLGYTQVIDKFSIFQTNLGLSASDGYFDDQYKLNDKRPDSKTAWTVLFRYVRFIPSFDSSLHLDYRLYNDDWGIASNMVEGSWYQPVGSVFTLVPRLRYSTQTSADFFDDIFPPPSEDIYYTTDQRMAAFGSITPGLKLIASISDSFSVSAAVDYLIQQGDLAIGEQGSPSISDFGAYYWSVGVLKKF